MRFIKTLPSGECLWGDSAAPVLFRRCSCIGCKYFGWKCTLHCWRGQTNTSVPVDVVRSEAETMHVT